MATLIIGGLATLMTSSGWVLPTSIFSAFAVATITRASFGFGVRQMIVGPIYGVCKLFMPAPVQLMLSGAEVVTTSALLVAGTGKAAYRGTRFVAGVAYLLISGVVSGTFVLLRLASREKLEDTVDKIQCLASTVDPSPPLAVLDLDPSSSLSVATSGPDTYLIRQSIDASSSQLSQTIPSSSFSSSSTTTSSPPPPPPRSHVPDSSNPFLPTDPSLVDPSGSFADLSVVLSSLQLDAASAPSSDSLLSVSAQPLTASALYPSLSSLQPEMTYEDWVFVQSSMTDARIRQEIQAATAPKQEGPSQEAVAQCSLTALSTLLDSYKQDEITDIQVFQSTDADLEHPVQNLTLDQLRQLVLTAQITHPVSN